jgi:hypothetical protein
VLAPAALPAAHLVRRKPGHAGGRVTMLVGLDQPLVGDQFRNDRALGHGGALTR